MILEVNAPSDEKSELKTINECRSHLDAKVMFIHRKTFVVLLYFALVLNGGKYLDFIKWEFLKS